MSLTKLFEAEFRGGRAASAPQTRVAAGAKPTMAEVMAVGRHRAMGETEELSGEPIMPHRMYSVEQLDALYPPLEAIEELEGDEVPDGDPLLAHGLKLAEGIAHDAAAFGRRRNQEFEESQQMHVSFCEFKAYMTFLVMCVHFRSQFVHILLDT